MRMSIRINYGKPVWKLEIEPDLVMSSIKNWCSQKYFQKSWESGRSPEKCVAEIKTEESLRQYAQRNGKSYVFANAELSLNPDRGGGKEHLDISSLIFVSVDLLLP